jgi:hypothetical protein
VPWCRRNSPPPIRQTDPVSDGDEGDVVYQSQRAFRLWHYTTSHSQLLLRSLRGPDEDTRIDLWFSAVDRVNLPVSVSGVVVRRHVQSFRLTGGDWDGSVEAGAFAHHEDDGDYDDPSHLFTDGL